MLIDGPDLTSTADAASLGQQVDGALLLARHGRTRAPQLRQACQVLALADVHVLGVVLNRVGRVRRRTRLRLTPQPLPTTRPPADADEDSAGLRSKRNEDVESAQLSTRR